MELFNVYLDTIQDEEQRERMETILTWVIKQYPDLKPEVKWNQPMFSYNGTFIIGFSIAKQHISFTPEAYTLNLFADAIDKSGYDKTKGLAKIKWQDHVDYNLVKQLIDFNMIDKADCKTFFRK